LDRESATIESEFKLVQQKKIKEHDFNEHVLDIIVLTSTVVKLQWTYFSMADAVNKMNGRIKFKKKIIIKKKEMFIQDKDRNLEEWFEIVKKIALFHIDRLGLNKNDYDKEFAELEIEKKFCINNRMNINEHYEDSLRIVNRLFSNLFRNENFKIEFERDLLRVKPIGAKDLSLHGVNKGFKDFFDGLIKCIEYLKGTDYVENQDELIDRMIKDLISKRSSYHRIFFENRFVELKSYILYVVKHYINHQYFVADVEIYLNKALGLK
jgi:hypothetical protein